MVVSLIKHGGVSPWNGKMPSLITLLGKILSFTNISSRMSGISGQVRLPFRFYHGYNNYMAHAFPHDDLKPLSYSYTDSLGVRFGPLARMLAAVAAWRYRATGRSLCPGGAWKSSFKKPNDRSAHLLGGGVQCKQDSCTNCLQIIWLQWQTDASKRRTGAAF